jgi:hypothetical protein
MLIIHNHAATDIIMGFLLIHAGPSHYLVTELVFVPIWLCLVKHSSSHKGKHLQTASFYALLYLLHG